MSQDTIDRLSAAAWARFCLENIRLFAARRRKEEWAQTVLSLCKEGGAVSSPLRDAEAPAPACVECGGPLQWRCPACRIAQSKAVAEAPAPSAAPWPFGGPTMDEVRARLEFAAAALASVRESGRREGLEEAIEIIGRHDGMHRSQNAIDEIRALLTQPAAAPREL